MPLCASIRSVVAVALAMICLGVPLNTVRGQVQADTDASTRDSLLSCATRMADAAGFQPAPGARTGRVVMMRTRPTPGSVLVDALSVAMAPKDSAPTSPLDVRVTTFITSRTTGLSQEEITLPRALTALADTIRLSCRRHHP